MVKLPVLLTVTVTDEDVVELPAASRAVAVTVCEPLGTVKLSQEMEYGLDVSSEPTLLPSSLNWTPETPTLSEALALSVTLLPDMLAPAEGAVRLTVGGVGSGDAAITTVVVAVAVPSVPVQDKLYVVSVVKLPVDCDPEVAFAPLHPPEALQEDALVELQVSVEAEPDVTVLGLADRVADTEDGGGSPVLTVL
jgi:hypothetical protein